MGVRRILHGGSSETERLFTVKINFVRDAMLIKTCRVQAWCLPYKFFAAVLDVLRECVEFNDLFGSVFINGPSAVDIVVLVKLLECWLIKP